MRINDPNSKRSEKKTSDEEEVHNIPPAYDINAADGMGETRDQNIENITNLDPVPARQVSF